MRRTAPPARPVGPPANAEEGAERVRAAAVKLFDKGDGTGANWRMMALSLFLAGFKVLDKLPEDARRTIAGRIHAKAELVMTGGFADGSGASNSEPVETVSAPSNTGVLKSPHPKGPR